MPNWKKIITSGSDATLQSLTVSTTITANSFKTPTGTSSQFLMADGSTNSNTYVKTDGTGATGTWGISITGNAATATTLQTARTLTIGATGKTFNGSSNVAWTLAEIGAQAALTNPITGTATSGQVAFFNGTTTQTGDTNLFWDNTNKRLGIGTTAPSEKLEVNGNVKATGFKTPTGTPNQALTANGGTFDLTTKLDKGTYTGTAQDLKNSIDSKANVSHTHDISNINGLQTVLDSKLNKGNYQGTAQDLKNEIDSKQKLLSSFDESILIETDGNIEGNVSLFQEYFQEQNCVLNFTPIQIIGVYKNGIKLLPEEFNITLPKTITIKTYSTEKIEIQYTHLKNN